MGGNGRAACIRLVHSLWDAEDVYGAPAVYRALEPKDAGNDKVVLGPWQHGQEIGDGSSLGAIRFGSDTALYFRQKVLRPFLDHFLKDGTPAMDVAPVTVSETGTNEWRRLSAWPPAGVEGPSRPTPLYLRAGLKLAFAAPDGQPGEAGVLMLGLEAPGAVLELSGDD